MVFLHEKKICWFFFWIKFYLKGCLNLLWIEIYKICMQFYLIFRNIGRYFPLDAWQSTYIRRYGFTFFHVKCSKTLDRLYVNKKINVKKYFDAKFYVKLRNRQLSILLCIQHTVAKADTVQFFFKAQFSKWLNR